MGWQERFRALGERLTNGEIGTDEYRRLSEEILAEADREASDDTRPTAKVRIPRSAAWEAPSGGDDADRRDAGRDDHREPGERG
jgi:hypothetical protein